MSGISLREKWLVGAIFGALLLALSLPSGLNGSAKSATEDEVKVHSTVTQPRYSAPLVFPVRGETYLGCVKTNCGPQAEYKKPVLEHGFWALDIFGEFGDGVYPAGNGVAHIGGRSQGCTSKKSDRQGTWAWVDHGGGLISKYYHLETLAVTEGQVVTTSTRLGGLGASGGMKPCTAAYLHFEVLRISDQGRLQIEPPPLVACHGDQQVTYPTALGQKSWNDVVPLTAMSSSGSDCVKFPPRSSSPTDVAVEVALDRSVRGGKVSSLDTMAVRWKPPGRNANLVTGYAISWEKWSKRTKVWLPPNYVYSSASNTSQVLRGLKRRWTYRVQVWTVDVGGSDPGPSQSILMAQRPGNPKLNPRSSDRGEIRLYWRAPDNRGSQVTGYRVGLSETNGRKAKKTSWRNAAQNPRKYTWRKLKPNRQYRIKVRGVNDIGRGKIAKMRLRAG
jgi:hypothetical protein